jgi:DNA-directed RNA polymerase specialized sigma24 family protein
MARVDWIEQRLQNWARWRLSGAMGALGYASVDLQAAMVDCDESRGPAIPTIDCEARETDSAIGLLASELKATVLQVYLGRGGMADHARRLCCTRATIDQRIWRAHRILAEHFTAQKDRQRGERARVEALAESSRPATQVEPYRPMYGQRETQD